MAGVTFDRLKTYSRCKVHGDNINILLVSTSQTYLEELQKKLCLIREIQKDKRPYNLSVHICKSIEDLLAFKECDFIVDFIVFLVDTEHLFCLKEVESNLKWLHPSITRERICIVNPNPNSLKSVLQPQDLCSFAVLHQFNIISGKILDSKGAMNLSKRILNLCEQCCGLVNGLPLIATV